MSAGAANLPYDSDRVRAFEKPFDLRRLVNEVVRLSGMGVADTAPDRAVA